VLVLQPIEEVNRAIARGDLSRFVELVQAGFKQPRKKLANSLAEGLDIPKAAAVDFLVEARIDPSKRPEALAVDDWVRLFRCSTARTPKSI
jgi:16S rRNA A1518/A1519 N6-dimethyltransferase RsmA/KsgA/DIM1 with predicted DNA glycosylase/AP lyase activity